MIERIVNPKRLEEGEATCAEHRAAIMQATIGETVPPVLEYQIP
jgi:hypothetical protein